MGQKSKHTIEVEVEWDVDKSGRPHYVQLLGCVDGAWVTQAEVGRLGIIRPVPEKRYVLLNKGDMVEECDEAWCSGWGPSRLSPRRLLTQRRPAPPRGEAMSGIRIGGSTEGMNFGPNRPTMDGNDETCDWCNGSTSTAPGSSATAWLTKVSDVEGGKASFILCSTWCFNRYKERLLAVLRS